MKSIFVTLLPRVFALLLWLITLAVGLVDIYFGREIFFAIYARFSTEGSAAAAISNWLVLILALVYLGFVVFTSEYHLRHVGQRASWKLFSQTLIVELVIPLLAYFLI